MVCVSEHYLPDNLPLCLELLVQRLVPITELEEFCLGLVKQYRTPMLLPAPLNFLKATQHLKKNLLFVFWCKSSVWASQMRETTTNTDDAHQRRHFQPHHSPSK